MMSGYACIISIASREIDCKKNLRLYPPAYDLEKGGEYGIGSVKARIQLFQRCAKRAWVSPS